MRTADQHFASSPAVEPDERFASSLVAVGSRLRDVRKTAGLSLRELSSRSGLSASFLSLVERGECSLSLTSLFAITQALKIDASDVLDAGAQPVAPVEAEFAVWRGPGRSSRHTVVGEREYFPFSPSLPGELLNPMYFRIHPTSTVAPLAVHEGEEVAYVISGTLYLRLRDEELLLGPGDAVHFSSETPHAIANKTSGIVEALWMTTNAQASVDHGQEPA